MGDFLPMFQLPTEYSLSQLCHFWCNGVGPGVAETKFGGGFFGGNFCWGFNGGPQGIAQCAGKFPVGVVDAPQFIVGVHG